MSEGTLQIENQVYCNMKGKKAWLSIFSVLNCVVGTLRVLYSAQNHVSFNEISFTTFLAISVNYLVGLQTVMTGIYGVALSFAQTKSR